MEIIVIIQEMRIIEINCINIEINCGNIQELAELRIIAFIAEMMKRGDSCADTIDMPYVRLSNPPM